MKKFYSASFFCNFFSGKFNGVVQPVHFTFAEGPDRYMSNGISVIKNQQTAEPNAANIIAESCCELNVIPNPFTSITTIAFALPRAGTVSMVMYDPSGNIIRQTKALYTAGGHQIQWEAADEGGMPVCSGIYYFKMTFGNQAQVFKLVATR